MIEEKEKVYISNVDIKQVIENEGEYGFISILINPEHASDLFQGRLQSSEINTTENACIIVREKMKLWIRGLEIPVDFYSLSEGLAFSGQFYLNEVAKKVPKNMNYEYNPLFSHKIANSPVDRIPTELWDTITPWEALRLVIHSACYVYNMDSSQKRNELLPWLEESYNVMINDERLKAR